MVSNEKFWISSRNEREQKNSVSLFGNVACVSWENYHWFLGVVLDGFDAFVEVSEHIAATHEHIIGIRNLDFSRKRCSFARRLLVGVYQNCKLSPVLQAVM